MLNESYLDVEESVTEKVVAFSGTSYGSVLLRGSRDSWGIVKSANDALEFNRSPIGAPLQDPHLLKLLVGELAQVPFGRFPNLDVDDYLKNFEGGDGQVAIVRRLRQAPFKIHYYHQQKSIHVDDLLVNTALTLLNGALVTELVAGEKNKNQHKGLPGEIIIGHKRSEGAEHVTTVQKGSTVLFRRADADWAAEPTLFRDDLLVLFLLNSVPILTLDSKQSSFDRSEFDIEWSGIDTEAGMNPYDVQLAYCGRAEDALRSRM